MVEDGEVAEGDCWLLVSIVWLLELDEGELWVLVLLVELAGAAWSLLVVLVAVEDWLLFKPAPLFCASGDWLPVDVALPPALVLWMLVCCAWFGSTGCALDGACAFGSAFCVLVGCAFGSVVDVLVDVLPLVCA